MTEDRLDVLVSPVGWKKGSLVRLAEENPDWNILLDSGAFSNFQKGEDVISLDWFRGFLLEHGDRFWRYFNLDSIGDHEESMKRFQSLREDGLDPIPVFQRGGSAGQLNELLDENELVGIGGIAGTMRNTGDRAYLRQVMRVAGDRRSRVHLLGVTGPDIVGTYRPFSADSSCLATARMYGSLRLWNGREFVSFSKRGSKNMRPDPALSRCLSGYGLKWEDLADHRSWIDRDGAVCVAGMRSWIRFSRFARRPYGVRVFLVDAPEFHHSNLTHAWAAEKQEAAA